MAKISSFTEQTTTSAFQKAIETVEALPLQDQEMLIDIIIKRLKQNKREQLLREVNEVEQDYAEGNVKYGSVSEFLSELDNCEV